MYVKKYIYIAVFSVCKYTPAFCATYICSISMLLLLFLLSYNNNVYDTAAVLVVFYTEPTLSGRWEIVLLEATTPQSRLRGQPLDTILRGGICALSASDISRRGLLVPGGGNHTYIHARDGPERKTLYIII